MIDEPFVPPQESAGEDPTPLDIDALTAQDVPASDTTFPTPDHKASRPARGPLLFSRPAGDKRDTPPRAKPKKATPRAKHGAFTETLENIYTGIGAMITPFDPVCGNAVIQSAPQCAKTLDDLAYQNDAVRRALTALVTTSATGAVVVAHMPILMAVMMHHVPAVQTALGKRGEAFAESVAREFADGQTDSGAEQ